MAKQLSRLNVSLTASTGAFSRGINGARKRLGMFERGVRSMNATLLRFAGAYAGIAAIRSATNTIAGFEQAIATVRGVTQASTEQMAQMTTQARELGATTQHTAAAAANAMLELSRAGLSVNEVLGTTAPVLNLATGAGIDLGRSATIVSGIMRQYRLNVGSAAHITDVLTVSANKSNTTVDMMAGAFGKVGPFAAAMGVSLEETAGLLGVLADNMIRGEEGGTNLRGVMAGLADVTPEAQRVIRSLGLSMDDVNIRSVGLTEAMRRLGEAGASPEQMLVIFERRNVASALALSKGADRANELRDAALGTDGAAKRLAGTMENTLSGSMKKFSSAIQEIVLSAGENGLLGILRGLTEEVTKTFRSGTRDTNAMRDAMKGLRNVIGLVGDVVQWLNARWLHLKVIFAMVREDFDLAVQGMGSGLTWVGVKAKALGELIKSAFLAVSESLGGTWAVIALGFARLVNGIGAGFSKMLWSMASALQKTGEGNLISLGSRLETAAGSIARGGSKMVIDARKSLSINQESLAGYVSDSKRAWNSLTKEYEVITPKSSEFTRETLRQAKAQYHAARDAENWSVGFMNASDRYSQAIAKVNEANKSAEKSKPKAGGIPGATSPGETLAATISSTESAITDSIARIRQQEDDAAVQSQAMWAASWQGKAQIVSGILGDLSTLMNSESRKMFEVGKVAAIAQATVDTIAGAQRVFTALAWNPPLAYSAAAAAYAAGIVRINQIRQTSFGGGGSSPSSPASGAAATGGSVPQGTSQTTGPGGTQQAVMQVQLPTVGADQFVSVESIRRVVREAKDRNVTLAFV